METIRLNLGLSNTDFFKKAVVVDNGGFDSNEMDTTLKDVSIILYKLCGCGVLQLLAKELSHELELPFHEVLSALERITKHYSEISNHEAYLRTFPEKASGEKTE